MKLIRIALPLIAAVVALAPLALSQEGPLVPDPPKGITSAEIIQKFAAKEKEFREARDQYTFRQDVRVLTSDEVSQYDTLYVGQQQEDELQCYVFDIAPKKIEPKRRYFQGRIWVDNQDLQIVKTLGKAVPETRKKNNENLFPKFTTWREQVDGKYWFPAYTMADDT